MTFEDISDLYCSYVNDIVIVNDKYKCKFTVPIEVHEFGFDIDVEDGFVFSGMKKDPNCPASSCEAIVKIDDKDDGKITIMQHDDLNEYSAFLIFTDDNNNAVRSIQILQLNYVQ